MKKPVVGLLALSLVIGGHNLLVFWRIWFPCFGRDNWVFSVWDSKGQSVAEIGGVLVLVFVSNNLCRTSASFRRIWNT